MKYINRILTSLSLVGLAACSDDVPASPGGNIVVTDGGPGPQGTLVAGTWTQYWPNLRHDGQPYEGDNFIVFSDSSSQENRKWVAEQAETSLVDIMQIFDVTFDDFDFIPAWEPKKIHILSDYQQWTRTGLAYRDGIIVRAKDSNWFNGDHDRWQIVFQHEIAHVVEFLLIGDQQHQQANAVWFREGFANYGARHHRIQTLEELQEWKKARENTEGGGNPIKIHVWSDFPQEIIDNSSTIEYYGFFELSVRYLFDQENGNGTAIEDGKNYYEDLGKGISRETAFETHFGMSMAYFEDNWWTLMEEYLSNEN